MDFTEENITTMKFSREDKHYIFWTNSFKAQVT